MPQDTDKPTYTAQELQQRCDWLLDKTSIVDSDGRYLRAIYDIVANMRAIYSVNDWISELQMLGGNGYLHKLVQDEEDAKTPVRKITRKDPEVKELEDEIEKLSQKLLDLVAPTTEEINQCVEELNDDGIGPEEMRRKCPAFLAQDVLDIREIEEENDPG